MSTVTLRTDAVEELLALVSTVGSKDLSESQEESIKYVKAEVKSAPDKVAFIWSVDDVIDHLPNEVNNAQARLILGCMQNAHDCEYGISWESISAAYDACCDDNDYKELG